VPTAKDSRCRVGWRRNRWRTNSPARCASAGTSERGRLSRGRLKRRVCASRDTGPPTGTSPVARVLRQRPDRCLGVPYRRRAVRHVGADAHSTGSSDESCANVRPPRTESPAALDALPRRRASGRSRPILRPASFEMQPVGSRWQ
jgi:hypothetical protein